MACKVMLLGGLGLSGVEAMAHEISLMVTNPTAVQRREVVSIKAKEVYDRLGLKYLSPVIVRNAYGQQVAFQLTSDSLLLVEASVFPNCTTTFHIMPGQAQTANSSVDGRLYAWRVDDFTWENDLTAYRAYGPALQKTGEKAFGFDVWLKSVPQLVVADRYEKVDQANHLEKELRAKGLTAEADSVKRENSLHLDHGNGLDCYNVGPTLGCGTPAIMLGDSIVMPYCYQTYKVMDNGPLRFTAEFVYTPTTIDGQRGVREHRLIRLDKGSYFNQITVWYEHLQKTQKLCSGVVLHKGISSNIHLGENFVEYADPTDSPEKHGFQIYVATIYPQGVDTTRVLKFNRDDRDIMGHAVGITTISPKQRYTYYFGAGWTGNGVRNATIWHELVKEFLAAKQTPLIVRLQ